MQLKIKLILLFCLSTICLYSQNKTETDSVLTNTLNKKFKGGEEGFIRYFGYNLKYPMEARLKCRIGILLTTVKIRPSGDIDSIQFNNEIELGLGLEDEVVRCLLSTKGRWQKSEEYSKFTFSVAFHMDESNMPNATVAVVAYGLPANGCPTNKDVIELFQKAKKKNQVKEAIELCEDILRRIPTSDEYKKELVTLKSKLLGNKVFSERKPIIQNPMSINITRQTPIFDKISNKLVDYEDYKQLIKVTPRDYIFEPIFDEFGQPSSYTMRERTTDEKAQNQFRMAADPTNAPKINEIIRPFVMGSINGDVFDSEKLTDNVVILYFMLDSKFKVKEKFVSQIKQVIDTTVSKGAIWLGLSTESPNEVGEFLEKTKLNYNIIPYSQGFQIRYSAFTTPSFIVIGKKGKVIANINDIMMDERMNELRDIILKALK